MDIEARGDTFEGVAFARGVGYFFNTGLGGGCLRQAEYLSFWMVLPLMLLATIRSATLTL